MNKVANRTQLYMTFTSFFRTEKDIERPATIEALPPPAPLPLPPPPAPAQPLPAPPVVQAPKPAEAAPPPPPPPKRMIVSIKTGNKASTKATPTSTPRPSISIPGILDAPGSATSDAAAAAGSPAALVGDSIVAASPARPFPPPIAQLERKPSIALTVGGEKSKTPKRPRPEKGGEGDKGGEEVSPAPKRPKLESKQSTISAAAARRTASPRPSRVVTFRVPGAALARLGVTSQGRPANAVPRGRSPLVSSASQRDSASPAALGAIEVSTPSVLHRATGIAGLGGAGAGASAGPKKERKPLPSSAPAHEGGMVASPTEMAPRPALQVQVPAQQPATQGAMAQPQTPAPARPKIVLKRPSQMG